MCKLDYFPIFFKTLKNISLKSSAKNEWLNGTDYNLVKFSEILLNIFEYTFLH